MRQSKKIKNIVIVNAHWNNRGDEAALLAVISGTIKSYEEAEITILFKDNKEILQFPKLDRVKYSLGKFNAKIWDIWLAVLSRGFLGFNKTLRKSVQIIKESNLVVYSPGGSVINKRFYWRKQMEYLVPILCAKIYGIPIFIAAPSMGPFDTSKSNMLLKWLLKTPKVLCVREDISKDYLKEIGIIDNVEVTIDSAFYNNIDLQENAAKLKNYNELQEFLNRYEKVVGLTISDFTWHVKLNKDKSLSDLIRNSFSQLIEKFEKENIGVLFIPQLFGNQNDYYYMDSFSRGNTFTMTDEQDCAFQQFIISKLYAVIGTRYHSNIFAAKMGTPFVAVIYEEKMEGFLKLAELMDYSLPLLGISTAKIFEKLLLVENNYQQIKMQLKENNKIWEKRASKTIELFRNYK